MALNIKNAEVERLAEEISRLTGETKTEAVRRALEERKDRLAYREAHASRADRLRAFLEREVWPVVPGGQLGRTLSKEEQETILGYGESGV